MNAVVLNDITKKYEHKMALRVINLELPQGKILGIIGPAGSGKTTLIKIICGLTAPSMGTASVFEYATDESYEKLHSVCGVAISGENLYGRLSAFDNLVFQGKASGMSSVDVRERASTLFHSLGIWDCRDLPAGKLSVSQYKKVKIACALVTSPKLVILDDVSLGIDDRSLCEIYDFITEQSKETGLSAIVTSELPEYMTFCDLFAILNEGEVIAKGDFTALVKNSGMKYSAALKTIDGKLSLPLDGFAKDGSGYFVKKIAAEADMTDIIERAVFSGNKLYEAKLVKPSLEEIYATYIGLGESQ